MDTSEEYIKMCDCPEIQDNFPYFMPIKSNEIIYAGNYVFVELDRGSTKWRSICLPRQDQIQEMAGGLSPDKTGYSQLLHDFFQFIEFNEIRYIKSFEQLWLAFYMHEKHGKVWDGEKWVKKEG